MSIAVLEKTADVGRSSLGALREATVSTDVVAEDWIGGCLRLRSVSAPTLLSFDLFGCDRVGLDIHGLGLINETLSVWTAAEKRYRLGLSTLASDVLLSGSYGMGTALVSLLDDDAYRPEVRQIVDIAFMGDWAPEVRPVVAQAAQDALFFSHWRPAEWGAPIVSATEDGEIILEWLKGDKEAVVSFDGDECFGYAVLEGDNYRPGSEDGRLGDGFEMPRDLAAYLSDA